MRTISKLSVAALLATTICCVEAQADIGTLGDVTSENVFDPGPPEIPVNPDGYTTGTNTGELIIGDTDVGGLTMDVGLQPAPLRSTTAIIGNEFLSVGRAEFVGIPSDWLIETSLIIGNEGQGFLDLLNSAKVQVGSLIQTNNQTIVTGTGEVIIGALPDGDGHVTISGPASRIVTADLFVGDEGDGKIEISTRGTMFTGNTILGNALGSYGKVALTDDGSVWKVGFDTEALDLTVGLLGRGILDISNEAKAEVSGDILVGPLGIVNLKSGGRMRVLPTSGSAVAVVNTGNIRGGGFVDFSGKELINQGFGLIRNKAINTDTLSELADPQTLVFTGALLTNNSTIFAQDGEMIFNAPVVNNSEIIVRDSFVQFPQGLTNVGATAVVVVGGDSTIHGVINPAPLSNFVILNDSIVTITGDLIFTEPFLLSDGDEGLVAASGSNAATLSIGIGTNPGYLTVTGDLDLTNAVLDLDFAGTTTPVIGDIVNLIQVQGNVTGTFENSTVNVGGKVWDIDYSGGDIFATFTGIGSLPGDFDGDGDVDGRDFLAWQRNPSIGSLSDWQAGYGQNGSLGAVTASVPEPGTMVLLITAALAFANRRK